MREFKLHCDGHEAHSTDLPGAGEECDACVRDAGELVFAAATVRGVIAPGIRANPDAGVKRSRNVFSRPKFHTVFAFEAAIEGRLAWTAVFIGLFSKRITRYRRLPSATPKALTPSMLVALTPSMLVASPIYRREPAVWLLTEQRVVS